MADYDIGDQIQLTGTFSKSGTNTDPTTITLQIKTPDGTIASYTYALSQLTKSATGIYYMDYAPTIAGTYYWRFAGTGAVVTAGEGYFNVRISAFS